MPALPFETVKKQDHTKAHSDEGAVSEADWGRDIGRMFV